MKLYISVNAFIYMCFFQVLACLSIAYLNILILQRRTWYTQNCEVLTTTKHIVCVILGSIKNIYQNIYSIIHIRKLQVKMMKKNNIFTNS